MFEGNGTRRRQKDAPDRDRVDQLSHLHRLSFLPRLCIVIMLTAGRVLLSWPSLFLLQQIIPSHPNPNSLRSPFQRGVVLSHREHSLLLMYEYVW